MPTCPDLYYFASVMKSALYVPTLAIVRWLHPVALSFVTPSLSSMPPKYQIPLPDNLRLDV
jgi:hypothetical protein